VGMEAGCIRESFLKFVDLIRSEGPVPSLACVPELEVTHLGSGHDLPEPGNVRSAGLADSLLGLAQETPGATARSAPAINERATTLFRVLSTRSLRRDMLVVTTVHRAATRDSSTVDDGRRMRVEPLAVPPECPARCARLPRPGEYRPSIRAFSAPATQTPEFRWPELRQEAPPQGAATKATPIMASRVTSTASFSSDQPSVPPGRFGNTR
jgi:hypothetical protein